jgi:flagellar L-ring protein precursor FlgH
MIRQFTNGFLSGRIRGNHSWESRRAVSVPRAVARWIDHVRCTLIRSLPLPVLTLLVLLATTTVLSGIAGNVATAQEKKKNKKQPPAPVQTPAPPPAPMPSPANGSLFTPAAAGAELVSDFKPRRVGDLVFVDVVEASTAVVSSSASRGRNSGTIGGVGTAVAAISNPAAATASTVIAGMSQRKFEGKGTTQRASQIQGRIVARVIEVLPNGDLRIEAEKLVKINREDERLKVSGIVRPKDVSADNAIATTSVGELQVELNGKGVASADNAPGWLFRLFDKISPF